MLANQGVYVEAFIRQKPHNFSPAHSSENFAELVCSNSFKAMRVESATGLLKEEMSRFSSICVDTAKDKSASRWSAFS